jgi:hypothetical protein
MRLAEANQKLIRISKTLSNIYKISKATTTFWQHQKLAKAVIRKRKTKKNKIFYHL